MKLKKVATTTGLQLLNKEIITQHISSLVTIKANYNSVKHQNIDLFQIPSLEDLIIPSQLSSPFDTNIQNFQSKLYEGKLSDTYNEFPVDDVDADINSQLPSDLCQVDRDLVCNSLSDVPPVCTSVPVHSPCSST